MNEKIKKPVGRPKGLPTKIITFRIINEPNYEKAIRLAVKAEKKRLKGYS